MTRMRECHRHKLALGLVAPAWDGRRRLLVRIKDADHQHQRKIGRWAFPKMISLRSVLAGVGFQDPQHFCDRLGVLMRTVARRDDVFALRAVHV
jgi:hypothetical protein